MPGSSFNSASTFRCAVTYRQSILDRVCLAAVQKLLHAGRGADEISHGRDDSIVLVISDDQTGFTRRDILRTSLFLAYVKRRKLFKIIILR